MIKITAETDTTVIDLLRNEFTGASNNTIKQYLKYGKVSLNGEVIKIATTAVPKDSIVQVMTTSHQKNTDTPFRLVWEDQDILVADKQAGFLSSGEGITRKPTLHKLVDEYVKEESRGKKRAFVVHRLDKEVTGLIVFAKSEEIQQKLKDNWKNSIKKYIALTEGTPEPAEGTVDNWLFDYKQKMELSSSTAPGAVNAISHYKLLRKEGPYSLIEVTLETGRKNQIRAHLSHINCPIVGDRKYGANAEEHLQVRLMACYLELSHPRTGKKMSWQLAPNGAFLKPHKKKRAGRSKYRSAK